jgi:Sulfotransferase family
MQPAQGAQPLINHDTTISGARSLFQIRSTAAEMQAQAREFTGIRDITDHAIEEPLERLLPSLNTEAQLSQSGAVAMEQRIVRILANRLRMLRDFRDHPEIDEQKIVRPVFLTGGPRTGSTKLHQMLAASGDFKFLPFWQAHTLSLRTGNRSENPADRIREADEYVRWIDTHAPRARAIHAYDTFEAEEETLLIEQGMFGYFIICLVFVPTFMTWYVQQDFRDQFRALLRVLQYLQWQFHDGDPRPWLLKYPAYQGLEPMLREEVPDCTLIATYRDPVAALPSASSLLSAYYEAYSDAPFDTIIGQMLLEGQSQRMELFIQARAQCTDLNMLDIAYPDLLNRSDRVIESAYARASMPLSDRAREAMRTWEREHQQHRFGANQATLEQFGLTREIVTKKFQPYIEQFRHLF